MRSFCFEETAWKKNQTWSLLEPKRAEPSIPVTDPRFVYRPAAATDVTITWRKFGWVPKGEQK